MSLLGSLIADPNENFCRLSSKSFFGPLRSKKSMCLPLSDVVTDTSVCTPSNVSSVWENIASSFELRPWSVPIYTPLLKNDEMRELLFWDVYSDGTSLIEFAEYFAAEKNCFNDASVTRVATYIEKQLRQHRPYCLIFEVILQVTGLLDPLYESCKDKYPLISMPCQRSIVSTIQINAIHKSRVLTDKFRWDIRNSYMELDAFLKLTAQELGVSSRPEWMNKLRRSFILSVLQARKHFIKILMGENPTVRSMVIEKIQSMLQPSSLWMSEQEKHDIKSLILSTPTSNNSEVNNSNQNNAISNHWSQQKHILRIQRPSAALPSFIQSGLPAEVLRSTNITVGLLRNSGVSSLSLEQERQILLVNPLPISNLVDPSSNLMHGTAPKRIKFSGDETEQSPATANSTSTPTPVTTTLKDEGTCQDTFAGQGAGPPEGFSNLVPPTEQKPMKEEKLQQGTASTEPNSSSEEEEEETEEVKAARQALAASRALSKIFRGETEWKAWGPNWMTVDMSGDINNNSQRQQRGRRGERRINVVETVDLD